MTEQLFLGVEIKYFNTFFLFVWMFTGGNLGGVILS